MMKMIRLFGSGGETMEMKSKSEQGVKKSKGKVRLAPELDGLHCFETIFYF